MDSKIEPVAWLDALLEECGPIADEPWSLDEERHLAVYDAHGFPLGADRDTTVGTMRYILALSPSKLRAALLAAEQRGREAERERLLPGDTRELIEQMVKGEAPMSRWIGSVDCRSYDDLVPWLEGQLREKLIVKSALDRNGDPNDLRDFVDGGVGAIESLLMTLRNVAAAIRKGEGT